VYISKFCISVLSNKKMGGCKAEHCERLSTERMLGPFKELCSGDAFVYDFEKCSDVFELNMQIFACFI